METPEQNTPDWLAWRHKGLGASDSPAIMGESPYKTLFQLWEEKIKPEPPKGDDNDFIHIKGHRLENVARSHYEFAKGRSFKAKLVEHSAHSYLRASLDGYNDESNCAVEFKFIGKDAWIAMAESKKVIDEKKHFLIQIQHQYMVTGCKQIDLCLYNDEIKKICFFPVPIDLEYIQKFLAPALEIFWNLVQTKKAPALTQKDTTPIKDKDLKAIITKWKAANKKLKEFKDKEGDLRNQIIKKLVHARNSCGDVSMNMSPKIGAIDYSKVPELKDVDLDKYRKDGSSSWKFTVAKSKAPKAKDSKTP